MQVKDGISIIIVNYNRYNLTIKCIESILSVIKEKSFEIIVIDNCSTNESFKKLNELYNSNKEVKVYKTKKNEGFGSGNNYGVSKSQYNLVLILNPDVIVLEGAIEDMKKLLLKNDTNGIVGCKMLNGDKTLQYSCRRFIKFNRFIVARTPIKKVFSKKYVEEINDEYLMRDFTHNEIVEVDWLMGSCLMFRREDFYKVDMFSKEYFMYFEDVDLCYKFKKMNKKVIYLPTSEVIHLHEQESVKKINKLTFYHLASMFKFYTKVVRERV